MVRSIAIYGVNFGSDSSLTCASNRDHHRGMVNKSGSIRLILR